MLTGFFRQTDISERSISMKYCSKCKKIHHNKELTQCPKCRRKLIDDPNYNSPVNIITANGFELERIKSALTDAEIPFSVKEERYDTGLQILNSAPPENCSFFVPLSRYDEAVDTLIGIGALDENTLQALDKEDEAFLEKSRENEKNDELPEDKARMIRILSFIAFLAILAGFVFLTDHLLSFITPLFQ